MGRQVNFYMHPKDLAEIEDVLRDRWKLQFFPRSVKCAPIEPLDSLALDYSEISRRDERMYAILCSKYDAEYGFHCYYNARWQQFMISVWSSPVIEFHRCHFDAKVLKSGRFYFNPQKEPEDFVRWADAVLRWVRRRYQRDGYLYAGPNAIEWRDSTGGVFDNSL